MQIAVLRRGEESIGGVCGNDEREEMKITKEILSGYDLTDKPVKHGGKWIYPSEWRQVKVGELYWSGYYSKVILAPCVSSVPLPVFTPCTLPPKPDAEWIKAHTPEGYTMTVNDDPDLESVPFVNARCEFIIYAKTNRGTDFHGLRYGVVLKKVEPVKPAESRSCDSCGNGPHCSAKCCARLCSISDTTKDRATYYANWMPKAKPLTLAYVPQLSNKETRKLVQDLLARVEKLEKRNEWRP